jgi:predicted dehydrogenase
MSRVIRVGTLGSGSIARGVHLRCYAAHPNAEIVAVMDEREEAARAAAEMFNVPRHYTDVDAFLSDPDLEAVSVCTFHPSHGRLAARAASAGKHVLVEKPLASNFADARAAVEAAKRAEVVLTVGYQPRFGFFWRKAKELIDRGLIGVPYQITVISGGWHQMNAARPWFHNRALAGGGILLDSTSYTAYMLILFFGRVRTVTALGTTFVHEKPARDDPEKIIPVDVEDSAGLLLRFENGAIGVVYQSWAERFPRSHTEIIGSEGRIIFSSGTPPVLKLSIAKAGVRGYRKGTNNITPPAGPPLDEQYAKCDDFLRSIIEGRPPLIDPEDACHAVEILDAAYRSMRDGCVVTLSGL